MEDFTILEKIGQVQLEPEKNGIGRRHYSKLALKTMYLIKYEVNIKVYNFEN